MDIRRIFYHYRRYHNSVDQLSFFAGYYLGQAVWPITCQVPLLPFGVTRRFSGLRGCLDEAFKFQFSQHTTGKEIEAQLASWYKDKHPKEYYVTVVMDTYITLAGTRTEAIKWWRGLAIFPKE
ncbi:MAG: hypothetical protein JO172_06905 [Hyphomicrobiales bacterium]|nr:hypothetical protein [Hyphomicrobiales bacterium]